MTNKAVWKFPLNTDRGTALDIKMPRNAKPLCVQMQKGVATIWCEIEVGEEFVTRSFEVVGTGWEFSADAALEYVGTWQDGPFVWHLYENHS